MCEEGDKGKRKGLGPSHQQPPRPLSTLIVLAMPASSQAYLSALAELSHDPQWSSLLLTSGSQHVPAKHLPFQGRSGGGGKPLACDYTLSTFLGILDSMKAPQRERPESISYHPEFDLHVVASRFVDGKRENYTHEAMTPFVETEKCRELLNAGYTLQVHQPQQQYPPLAKLIARLENELGGLVGCNAYITPEKTQGLAPHWDDVDVLVVQTEGQKKWSVSSTPPPTPHAPPCEPSGDLHSTGKALFSCTMAPGDALYLPRGTVHSAVAVATTTTAPASKKQKRASKDDTCGVSCHLTFSFRHRQSYGDLISAVVNAATHADPGSVAAATGAAQLLRSSLPFGIGHLQAKEGQSEPNGLQGMLAGVLRKLADEVDAGGVLLSNALDDSAKDFFGSRLPPPDDDDDTEGRKGSITPSSRIVAVNPGYHRVVRALVNQKSGWWDPEADEGNWVTLLTSTFNRLDRHMINSAPPEEEEEVDFHEYGEDYDEEEDGYNPDGGYNCMEHEEEHWSHPKQIEFESSCTDGLLRLFHGDGAGVVVSSLSSNAYHAQSCANKLYVYGLVRILQ